MQAYPEEKSLITNKDFEYENEQNVDSLINKK